VTGDDQARFTQLFEEHRQGVHAFLLARTSDAEVARDLLQETFLRLWRRLDEVVVLAEDRQRAWLYTVARNLVIDRYRTEASRRDAVSQVGNEVARIASAQVDTVDRLADRDDIEHLEAEIARLPEDQRVVLTMVAVAEMTSQQVGEALDLPPGTVRYKLHQARTRLADSMERR